MSRRSAGSSVEDLFSRARDADRRSLARLFTRMERDDSDLRAVMRLAYPLAGRASVIGVTGPPGAGKSTIVDGVVGEARARGNTVGVLAVDPSSPLSGGALLGDRIRMQASFLDRAVFIRSLATRGAHGGLARVAQTGVRLLDAVGKQVIIVETVGVGQSEIDIMRVADVVVAALVPESGDSVQTLKAGLLEIADIFAVNKADRDGAGQFASAIRAMLALRPASDTPPALMMTQAHKRIGLPELYEEAMSRIDSMRRSGALAERRSRQARDEVARLLSAALGDAAQRAMTADGETRDLLRRVDRGDMDPHSAALRIIASGALAAALDAER